MLKRQTGCDKLPQALDKQCLRDVGDAARNAWEKFRPITVPSLGHLFCDRKSIEAAISDPCNVLGTTIASLESRQAGRLSQDCLGHPLDEKGNAVGLANDLVVQRRRQHMLRRNLTGERRGTPAGRVVPDEEQTHLAVESRAG